MKLRPYGDNGVLIDELSDAERSAWLAQLEGELPAGCSEYVVGQDRILLIGQGFDLRSDAMPIAPPVTSQPALCHDIEVNYNGADLDDVARATGLSVVEVIRIHCAPTYTVRMMGFSPGFPYLDGLDPRLHLDRRSSPRNRIEPGTVAIGGPHAGIYSVASPGGWYLLGQTDLLLFDLEAARQTNPSPKDVFALLPGDRVRFYPKEVRK